jgi:hypothetical protein
MSRRLPEARETLDLVFSVVAADTATKRRQRQVLRQLRENQLACLHVRDLHAAVWFSAADSTLHGSVAAVTVR